MELGLDRPVAHARETWKTSAGPSYPDARALLRRGELVLHLDQLREAARAIEEGKTTEEVRQQARHVLDPTTSMGGARPKKTVEDERGLWVAKFPARGDRWNNAAVEAAMLRLAMPVVTLGHLRPIKAPKLQRWSSRPRDDQAELFRRVVFTALISNNDDHPRNHSVVAAGEGWRLAPA